MRIKFKLLLSGNVNERVKKNSQYNNKTLYLHYNVIIKSYKTVGDDR